MWVRNFSFCLETIWNVRHCIACPLMCTVQCEWVKSVCLCCLSRYPHMSLRYLSLSMCFNFLGVCMCVFVVCIIEAESGWKARSHRATNKAHPSNPSDLSDILWAPLQCSHYVDFAVDSVICLLSICILHASPFGFMPIHFFGLSTRLVVKYLCMQVKGRDPLSKQERKWEHRKQVDFF